MSPFGLNCPGCTTAFDLGRLTALVASLLASVRPKRSQLHHSFHLRSTPWSPLLGTLRLQVTQRQLCPPCLSAFYLQGSSYSTAFGLGRPHGPFIPAACMPLVYTAPPAPQPSASADLMTIVAPATYQPSTSTAPAAPQPSASTDSMVLVTPAIFQSSANKALAAPQPSASDDRTTLVAPAASQSSASMYPAAPQSADLTDPTILVATLLASLHPLRP